MSIFLPHEKIDSLHNVDLEKLKKNKIKGIILDFDNTILAYNSNFVDDNVKIWIKEAKDKNFKIVILSNSFLKTEKVKRIESELSLPIITFSNKPFSFGFKKALKLLNTQKEETVIIGDQTMTDIFGGKRFGLYTILVKPLSDVESFTTRINRVIERIILKFTKE